MWPTKAADGRRLVRVGERNPKTGANQISTTKYTLLTFVPLFALEQVRNVVNVFFLAISAIQLWPGITSLGKHTTITPLCVIFLVTAAKEIFEDIRRRVIDRKVNNQLAYAYTREEGWQITKWSKLKVGNIVRLKRKDPIPADLVLLSSSEPGGMAYMESSNLDGESNLKIRQALGVTNKIINDEDAQNFAESGPSIECDGPNRSIYDFEGNLHVLRASIPSDMHKVLQMARASGSDESETHVAFSLNSGQLMPRGARLVNTDWIYGVVVYSGKQTKLMMNSTRTVTKSCFVNKVLNKIMMCQFTVLLVMCAISSALGVYSFHQKADKLWYLGISGSHMQFHMTFLGQLTIFSGFIPISLFVSLEDLEIYDERSDTRAQVRRSQLNEVLGQVRYVLSDKTGTLTENKMVFRMCSVGGRKYGSGGQASFSDSSLSESLASTKTKMGLELREFFRILAVCHTVVPERSDTKKNVHYHASSPDEAALVKCARKLDFVFHTRTPEFILVDELGVTKQYDVLNVLEFSSDRKRMSVIVRTDDGRILLLIKGADNVILRRLSAKSDKKLVAVTTQHLVDFAKLGYRTLCIAKRELTEEQYLRWAPGYYQASCAMEKRQELIAEQAELVEKDLILVGVTAIEDKLQRGVPETITRLAASSVKVWVLTGDKAETALNVGNACKLLTPDLRCVLLTEDSDRPVIEMVSQLASGLNNSGCDEPIAVIVDGESLKLLVDDDLENDDFVRLAIRAKCVICCRCTPSQKAAMVNLVVGHQKQGAVLAIGDGANDVAMIQAAEVGIGISGQEGMQASLAADYSIAQFRFLQRLLFVHGTLSYIRTVQCIFYSCYKNAVQSAILMIYLYVAGVSETALFDSWCVVLYNMFFANLPAMVLGLLDRPTDVDEMAENPRYYRLSQDRSTFTLLKFGCWMLESAIHSAIIFLLIYAIHWHDIMSSSGEVATLASMGSITNFTTVVVVNLKALLEMNSIGTAAVVCCLVSVACYPIWLCLHTLLFMWDLLTPFFDGSYSTVLIETITWPDSFLIVLLVAVTCMSVDLVVKAIQGTIALRERTASITPTNGAVGPEIEPLLEPLVRIFDRIIKKASHPTGYAFSQDDGNTVTQSDLIRSYDSRSPKRAGGTLSSDRSVPYGTNILDSRREQERSSESNPKSTDTKKSSGRTRTSDKSSDKMKV